jgi:hypothetical protein
MLPVHEFWANSYVYMNEYAQIERRSEKRRELITEELEEEAPALSHPSLGAVF